MLRTTIAGALLLCTSVIAVAQGQAPGDAPKPLEPSVRQAWIKAGFEVGWMKADEFWFQFGTAEGSGKPDEIAAFRWIPLGDFNAGVLGKVPLPAQEFGLDLSRAIRADSDLRALGRFKQLQFLDIGDHNSGAFSNFPLHGWATDLGLKELIGLQELRGLDICGQGRVTDAGVKHLAKSVRTK